MATVSEKMTSLADAIRGKTGGTELLGLDAMIDAITGLEIGGMPDKLVAFNHGSHTPTSDKSVSIGIKHGLGTKPTFVIFYTKEPPTSNGFDEYMVRQFIFSQDVYRGTSGTTRTTITIYVKGNGSAFSAGTRLSNIEADVIDDEYFHVFGNSTPLKAGTTYNWFAGVLEEL